MSKIMPEDSLHYIGKMAASTADDASEHWVGGDGGPLLILQSSAAIQWQGAMGSEDDFGDIGEDVLEIDSQDVHLYAAGEVGFATDSDAAFLCGDYITRRYGRDMLVLEPGEWSGRLFLLPSGAIGVVQVQCIVEDLPAAIQKAMLSEPERSGEFQMQDEGLRLMLGADTGTGNIYRHLDVPFSPGMKQWKRYIFDLGCILIIE